MPVVAKAIASMTLLRTV